MKRETLDIEPLYDNRDFHMNDKASFFDLEKSTKEDLIRFEKLETIKEYIINASIEDFIFIVIRSLRNRYHDLLEFKKVIILSNEVNDENYSTVSEKTIRSDIEHIVWKRFEKNSVYHNRFYSVEFLFKKIITTNNVKDAISESLKGKNYIEDNGIYKIENSPLSKLIITDYSFTFFINEIKIEIE